MKLFQPFTQADMSTTRVNTAGTYCYYLTICRRLVELMGGRICSKAGFPLAPRFISPSGWESAMAGAS